MKRNFCLPDAVWASLSGGFHIVSYTLITCARKPPYLHMFTSNVTTCLDYCNSVLAGASRSATDKLQRLLNAATRLVSGTRKFDRGLSRLLHVDLHWLDVPERVEYKLCVTVRRCQQHKAPQYLTDCLTSASDIACRQRLRSALPVVINCLCRVTNSAHLVVGPLLSLDQRLGIRCRLTSAIRRVVTSLSDVH